MHRVVVSTAVIVLIAAGTGCDLFGGSSPAPDSQPGRDTSARDGGGEACVPSCGKKQCGGNGCGGQCGHCMAGAVCSASGECVPDCASAAEGTACGAGFVCLGGKCQKSVCGDKLVDKARGEQCDPGDLVDGDGCDKDCTFTEILSVRAGYRSTCALIEGGRVRCWGSNNLGQLGYGHTKDIGDDESPASAGDVGFSKTVTELTVGDAHGCVLLPAGAVKCWGDGSAGKLGYGDVKSIGDDEFPVSVPDVQVGGEVVQVAAGGSHTCARLVTGKVRCWGDGSAGKLGYGDVTSIGDNELPSSAGDVPLGAAATFIATGIGFTCAVTAAGAVRCWGLAFSGELGYGNTNAIGDNELPSSAGDVPAIPKGLPATTKAKALSLGMNLACALFDNGAVLCWGANAAGQLGQGNTTTIGDNEAPSSLPPIDLPAPAVAITAGDSHACALLQTGQAYCWGSNTFGQLGYGHTQSIGDNEKPASAGPLQLGAPVKQIDAGGLHTCAVLTNNQVRCWGQNIKGQLGYGHTKTIGDDELPSSAGPVPLL